MITNVTKVKGKKISVVEDTTYLPDYETNVAELAYYKAEKRGFEAGHELDDWIEAERELGYSQ